MRNEATSSKSNILHVYLTLGPNQRRQQALSDGAFWFVFQQHCVAPPTLKPHWSKIQASFNWLLCSVNRKCAFYCIVKIFRVSLQHLTIQWNSQCFQDFVSWCLWYAVSLTSDSRLASVSALREESVTCLQEAKGWVCFEGRGVISAQLCVNCMWQAF